MRIRVTSLLLLVVGTASPVDADPLNRSIYIYNNSDATIYPVISIEHKVEDPWLQAQFENTRCKFGTTENYRFYPKAYMGIPKQSKEIVILPFYSQVDRPDCTQSDQYIDWWNDGRILLYTDGAEILADFTADVNHSKVFQPVGRVAPYVCEQLEGSDCSQPILSPFFGSTVDLPEAGRSQLLKYTFADVISKDGKPFLQFENVSYNMSSANPAHLPVAIGVLSNQNAAYAFSVRGGGGEQRYKGNGIVIVVGQIDGTQFDNSKRVAVTFGVSQHGAPEWAEYGLCSDSANTGKINSQSPSFEFWPLSYPCTFTTTDTAQATYHLTILDGPPNLAMTCDGPRDWCASAYAVPPNNIQGPPPQGK